VPLRGAPFPARSIPPLDSAPGLVSRCLPRGVVVSSSIVLVCAVLASLAAGVLLAYAVCLAIFTLFEGHVRQIGRSRAKPVIAAAPATEG